MYLTEARPGAKSTVVASQRVCQQLGAAAAFAVGGYVFDVLGLGVICTIVGAAVLACMPLAAMVGFNPHGPAIRAQFKRAVRRATRMPVV